MLDDNKQCKNCGFDTMAIVTEDTSEWEYCPRCGSRFVSVKDDIEGNVDEENVKMKNIPLNEDDKEEREEPEEETENSDGTKKIEINSSKNEENEGSSSENQIDENIDIEEELNDETVDIEEELERLRKFADKDSEDSN